MICKRSSKDQAALDAELSALPDLDRPALLECWRRLYETDPPAHISRSLLIQALAYRMQEKVSGGLKPSARRYLERIAEGDSAAQQTVIPVNVKPGTRLLREWHGVIHEVVVMENGVMFKGKRYKSLSEVAREITGAKWSGPLFFGLRKKSHG